MVCSGTLLMHNVCNSRMLSPQTRGSSIVDRGSRPWEKSALLCPLPTAPSEAHDSGILPELDVIKTNNVYSRRPVVVPVQCPPVQNHRPPNCKSQNRHGRKLTKMAWCSQFLAPPRRGGASATLWLRLFERTLIYRISYLTDRDLAVKLQQYLGFSR